MYPVLKNPNAPQSPANGPLTRKQFRRVMNAVARANAPGKDGRIEKAASKRDRKNAKRALTCTTPSPSPKSPASSLS